MGFAPPGPDERLRAVGSLESLAPEIGRALAEDRDFDPIPPPGRHDWLSITRERGQTFERFTRTISTPPDVTRRHVYLQPLGDFSPEQSGLLQQLSRFGSAFFVHEVRLLTTLAVEGRGIATRRNRYTDVLQLKTRDILPLLARDAPPDARCVVGIAADDLYPDDSWNFVFGEALLDDRVGVFSIARYDPRFYGKPVDDPTVLLRRTCKVLAHETCHMLGMLHCIFYNCVMNGSNHLAESDRRPLHLCPVDLRKLYWSFEFDMAERYRRLLAFWKVVGVDDEVRWIERRLDLLDRR